MQAYHDEAVELQRVLHHEIPMSQQMGLTVQAYDGACLTLHAPLAPNVNHQATVFAGSLTAVATLTGWGLTWLLLREHGLHGVIVIHEGATRYLLPVEQDFVTICQIPAAQQVERFIAGLRRRSKARIALAVDILTGDGRVAVAFTGSYVAVIDQAHSDSE